MTLLKRLPGQLSAVTRCSGSIRSFSAIPEAVENDETVTVTVNPYKLHRLEEGPSTEVETSKSELLGMFKTMYTMRRMELAADLLYKQKLARGFLHLADGQEAVPTGAAYDLPFCHRTCKSISIPHNTHAMWWYAATASCGLCRHGGSSDISGLDHSELQGSLHIPWQRWHGALSSLASQHIDFKSLLLLVLMEISPTHVRL